MKKHIERLRGMHDRLPEAYQQQSWVKDRLSAYLAQAGYAPGDPHIPLRAIVPSGRIFPLYISVHDTGPERRSPLLHVCRSHNGKGAFLVVARDDFS